MAALRRRGLKDNQQQNYDDQDERELAAYRQDMHAMGELAHLDIAHRRDPRLRFMRRDTVLLQLARELRALEQRVQLAANVLPRRRRRASRGGR